MAHKNDPAVEAVLTRLGNGAVPVRIKQSLYDVAGRRVHTRWKSANKQGTARYPFNYGPTSLSADYELWVCGSTECFYLVPTDLLRRHYHESQRDHRNPDLAVVTVYTDRDEVRFSAELGLDLSAYRDASLPPRESRALDAHTEHETAAPALTETESPARLFAEAELEHARREAWRRVVERPGQAHFRQRLLTEYGPICAISGCDVAAALEAAHIVPVAEGGDDESSNGLLLRADLHLLFDIGLLWIGGSGNQPCICISTDLLGTSYAGLAGRPLTVELGEQRWRQVQERRGGQ